MTIEISPASTANTSKPAVRNEAQASKAKAGADAPASGAGFMAILGALSDASEGGANPLPGATDEAALSDAAATLSAPFDANLLLQQNPQIGAAQAALSATGAPDVAGSKVAAGGAAAKAVDAQAASNLAGARDTLQATESLTQTLQRSGAHTKAAKELAQNAASEAASNTVAASAGDQAAVKDARLMATLEASRSNPMTKALEPVFTPLMVKAEKSQSERTGYAAKSTEPTYGGTALGVSGPDFSLAAAPAAAMTPDMQVAEQVTYWVTQNVQNAELQLDGLGTSPVEVSITVQGNEAQINFRSDEAATRDVLENAGAHLKDLLQREGMVLTGVSVGNSRSGDAGDHSERRGRPGTKQAAIAPLQSAAVETGRRLGVATGRAVDLFV